MATRDELIRQAEAKYQREELIKQAEAKFAQQQAKPVAPEMPMAPVEATETAVRSLAEGLTLGASEPVWSSINAVSQNLLKSGENPKDVADFLANAFSFENIKAQYDLDVARRRALKAEYPGVAASAEMASALIPYGAAARAGKALGLAGGALGEMAAASKAAQAAKAIPGAVEAGKIAEAAAIGAGTTAAQYGVQKGIEEATGFVKPGELPPVSEVAKLGGGVTGAVSAAPLIGKAGKAAVSSMLGIPEEAMQAYLKEAPAVRPYIEGAKAVEGIAGETPQAQLKQKIDIALEPFKVAKVGAEKAAVAAKEEAAVLKADFKQAVALRKQELADELRTAKTAAEGAEKAQTQFFKGAQLPKGFADDVVDSAEKLKARLGEESQKSYAILEKQKGAADFSNIVPEIKATQQSLLVDGQLLSAEEAKAFAAVQDWMEKLPTVMDDFGAVPFSRVKRVIQSLDRDIQRFGTPGSADFSDLSRSKLMEVRSILDSRLKSIPEYAEQMKTVKGLMDLRGEVSSFLGRENRIGGKLDRLWVPENPDADLVARLGQATGKDFASPLVEFGARKQAGANPALLEQAIKALPETSQLLKAQAKMSQARRIGAEQQLAKPEYIAWVKSQDDLAAAQNALIKSQQMLKAVGPLANEVQNFSAVRTLMLGKNPAYDTYLKSLSSMTGEAFEREVRAARTAEQFMMDNTRGSRNVNQWALGAGGSMLAYTGDPMMAGAVTGLGAVLGGVIDRYGTRVAQKLLDGYLAVEGMPTVGRLTLAFSSLPDSLRREMVTSFARGVAASPQETFNVPKTQKEYALSEVNASRGLTALQKARATAMIQNKSAIDSKTVKSIMLDLESEAKVPQTALGDVFKAKKRPEVEADKR